MAFLLVVLATSVARAVYVQEQPLQTRLQRSDLVVVAIIEATRTISGNQRTDRVAVARAIVVVKGVASRKVEFFISSDIAEWELNCCVVGKRYLLFLERTTSGRYEVVNSKFGAYPLDTDNAK